MKNPRAFLLLGLAGMILFLVISVWPYRSATGEAARLLWGYDSDPIRYKITSIMFSITPLAVYSTSLMLGWNSPAFGRGAMLAAGLYRTLTAVIGAVSVPLQYASRYYGQSGVFIVLLGYVAALVEGLAAFGFVFASMNPKRPDIGEMGQFPEPPASGRAQAQPLPVTPPPATP